MKVSYIIIILLVFAWPLYYLYQLQLGAVSFLLLAIFFMYVTVMEYKKLKEQKKRGSEDSGNEKIKRNNN